MDKSNGWLEIFAVAAWSCHLCDLLVISRQDRENQRVQWLRRCVDELMNNTWVLPALKQMEEIFGLFPEVVAILCDTT